MTNENNVSKIIISSIIGIIVWIIGMYVVIMSMGNPQFEYIGSDNSLMMMIDNFWLYFDSILATGEGVTILVVVAIILAAIIGGVIYYILKK
ncbi:hypothetical protein [Methanobrevibacter sp. DSM 116169]|uniref:hypothetical protein n=1 Tax=Methanobrevibacter sp. DSM 116169 TaxID=3242727 RepID=UPI0038FCCFB2